MAPAWTAGCLSKGKVSSAQRHRRATGRRRSALEEGWLVRELSSMGRPLARIATSLGRSTRWVSRRLELATALPTTIDTAVREGRLSPRGAMRSLVPLARANKGHAETLVAALGRESITTRHSAATWSAYRIADAEQRARMLEKPLLWLRAKASVLRGLRHACALGRKGLLEARDTLLQRHLVGDGTRRHRVPSYPTHAETRC